MNLESIQDLLFSIYESIDDLLCFNSKSVYNLRLPKNRNLGMIYKNLDFFNLKTLNTIGRHVPNVLVIFNLTSSDHNKMSLNRCRVVLGWLLCKNKEIC